MTCKATLLEAPGIGEMMWCEPCAIYFGKSQSCPTERFAQSEYEATDEKGRPPRSESEEKPILWRIKGLILKNKRPIYTDHEGEAKAFADYRYEGKRAYEVTPYYSSPVSASGRNAIIDECAKLVMDIGNDWAKDGAMQKVYACDYLFTCIQNLKNPTDSRGNDD